jgi:hypothetical protein
MLGPAGRFSMPVSLAYLSYFGGRWMSSSSWVCLRVGVSLMMIMRTSRSANTKTIANRAMSSRDISTTRASADLSGRNAQSS